MSVFVLDPAGRPLRPVPARKAASKVARGNARWLHAPGVMPDCEHGTIVMTHDVSPAPADPPAVQVFDADGRRLGSVAVEDGDWPAWLRRAMAGGQARAVGRYAVLLLAPASEAIARQLEQLEYRRAWRRLLDRDRVITETLRAIERGEAPEAALERLIRSELAPGVRRLALAELRTVRARLERLDLARARDTAPIRRALVPR